MCSMQYTANTFKLNSRKACSCKTIHSKVEKVWNCFFCQMLPWYKTFPLLMIPFTFRTRCLPDPLSCNVSYHGVFSPCCEIDICLYLSPDLPLQETECEETSSNSSLLDTSLSKIKRHQKNREKLTLPCPDFNTPSYPLWLVLFSYSNKLPGLNPSWPDGLSELVFFRYSLTVQSHYCLSASKSEYLIKSQWEIV